MNAGDRLERRICLALFIASALIYASSFGLIAGSVWGAGAFVIALAAC